MTESSACDKVQGDYLVSDKVEVMEDQQQALSAEDWNDAYLAHQYRLSLPSSPSQSNFRVLALLFYEELTDNESSSISHLPPWIKQQVGNRNFIVGTNDEPGYMGGAICAERAAMVQLRFVPKFKLTKVVIATDCETVPISPGMLCREFLAGHGESVPWDLTVISTGSQCLRCKKKDTDTFGRLPNSRGIRKKDEGLEDEKACCCIDGHANHSIATLRTTIAELYPFPSPYTRLKAPQSVALGTSYAQSAFRTRDSDSLDATAKRLLEMAIAEAKQSVSNEVDCENHPIHFGAAVLFKDESISTIHQSSALEYGCTLDAVSQLVPYIRDTASPPVLIIQADQYGVAHSPFAPARAYLSEHSYNGCLVLVHATDLDDVPCLDRWELKKVRVDDLAPTPPAWTTA